MGSSGAVDDAPETLLRELMHHTAPHTHTPHVGIGESFENGTHTHTLSQQAAKDLRHHQQGSSDAEPVQAQQSEQSVHAAVTYAQA